MTSKELFEKMDKDESGAIEFEEFIYILDHPIIRLTRAEIKTDMETCFR